MQQQWMNEKHFQIVDWLQQKWSRLCSRQNAYTTTSIGSSENKLRLNNCYECNSSVFKWLESNGWRSAAQTMINIWAIWYYTQEKQKRGENSVKAQSLQRRKKEGHKEKSRDASMFLLLGCWSWLCICVRGLIAYTWSRALEWSTARRERKCFFFIKFTLQEQQQWKKSQN